MEFLYGALAACAVLALFTLGFALKKQIPKTADEVVRLSETAMTALLGAMLLALGIALPLLKLWDPTAAGTDQGSYLFVAGMSVLCAATGCFAFLYTFVKKVIALPDGILCVTFWGRQTRIAWQDVDRLDTPLLSKSVKVCAKNGDCFTVNGAPKAYHTFLELAKQKLRPVQGKELLDKVEEKLRYMM